MRPRIATLPLLLLAGRVAVAAAQIGVGVNPETTDKVAANEKTAATEMTPKNTVIVDADLPGRVRPPHVLQEKLRWVYDTDTGFEVMPAGRAAGTDPALVIQFQKADETAARTLDPYDFTIRRTGNTITFTARTSDGAMFAVNRFLDEHCGYRMYMASDQELFSSRPKDLPVHIGAITMDGGPYVKAGSSHTWGAPGGGEFMHFHGLFRRPTSHQHTMFDRFHPDMFAKKYPEIYPIRNGKPFFPERGDQKWQPCFSEPKLVDAGVQSARAFFKENPDCPYVAFAIQDSHEFCQRDLETAVVKEHGKAEGLSILFWTWLNKVARQVENESPDKLVLGLAYSNVRYAPDFKLNKNILSCMVFKIADIKIDAVFREGGLAENWAKVASHVGNHDWAYGYGYLIPRIYTGLIQETFLNFEKLNAPLRFMYAEAGPNWGMDGPKLYLMARMWYDPHIDIRAEQTQFCHDMFGPASKAMNDYFMTLEEQYLALNSTHERKLFKWTTQFLTTPPQRTLVRKARTHLEAAKAQVEKGSVEARRIALFDKSYKLAEMLFELQAAETVTPQQVEEVKTYFRKVIQADPHTIDQRGKPEQVFDKLCQPALRQVTKGKVQVQ